ncbi:immunoglobulin superfamily member 6 [Cololabis saira]|uniref:immunoglobulin superfamily member 6 n=1 Tax=Cololabis saira TaxID=129043 RepID=UPI002AD29AF0|nr:immunoglobulin superfamily member 6 [Cololabis saira]
MKRLFWLSLLLAYLPGTESLEKTERCLTQPNYIIWHKTGQSAVLPCTIRSDCSAEVIRFEWFVFKESEHFRLHLDSKYSLKGASLHINSLNVNDSGIYYCAAVTHSAGSCCKESVGLGTTLVVRGRVRIMMKHILMWSSLALLITYSLVIATLILKKHGCTMSGCRKTSNSTKNSLRKKTQFRDVLQELHRRGNLRKSKQTRGSRSQAEAAGGESNISTDCIYQNI